MNFETIITSRLILKGIFDEDMKYIFENLTKPEIKRILGHRSEEEYRKEEIKHINGYSSYNRRFILFLLTDKESNSIIGRCGLHNWNKEHKRAEIGYKMEDESYRGKGLMTEAVNAIIDYGFNTMNLNRIEALVGIGNVPSLRILEKHHFIREGVLRQHCHASNQFEDSVLFSKLYRDYVEEKKNPNKNDPITTQ
jgi:[ribosomal protein S5]-alanine N-acetyltransferase